MDDKEVECDGGDCYACRCLRMRLPRKLVVLPHGHDDDGEGIAEA